MFCVDAFHASGRKGVARYPLYGDGIQMGCGNVRRKWRLSTGYTVSELCSSENSRSQWPRGLRRRSAAARLPRLWVRICGEQSVQWVLAKRLWGRATVKRFFSLRYSAYCTKIEY